jgi:hypothetical protein
MHREPAAHHPRLGQLVLILKLDTILDDLPATPTPRFQRRVELLINLPRRLTMTVLAVIITRPAPGPASLLLGLSAGERRRLALPRPTRLLKLPLKLRDPGQQPPVLRRQPDRLTPQQLVLRRQPSALIHQLGWEHHNL